MRATRNSFRVLLQPLPARLRPGAAVRSAAGTALLLALAGSSPALAAKGTFVKHPSIGEAATAKCESCHDKVFRGKSVHPKGPKGCLSCHEFWKQESGLAVRTTKADPQLCVDCHKGYAAAATGKLKAPHGPVSDACAHCHKAHASEEAHLLVAPARELCSACHSAEDVGKVHAISVTRADCGSCHEPHGSNQKGMLGGPFVHAPFGDRSCDACHRAGRTSRAKRGTRASASSQAPTCFACHSESEKKFAEGQVHTAVKDGNCTGCHNPHVADNKSFLKAKGVALCFPCHAEVRARVADKVVHPPVKQDCGLCHLPHSGPAEDQLKSAPPALCLGCHPVTVKAPARDAKGRPATTGATMTVPSPYVAKHLGADMTKLACAGCHEPHGSSQKGLFHPGSQHVPFTDGACETCHLDGKAGKLAGQGGSALCLACHGVVGEAVKKAKFPHAALEGACTACHTPHASRQGKLVRAPGGQECLGCHPALEVKEGEFGHGVVARLGCEACHEPHGSANPKLLRVTGSALCLGCHDERKLRLAEGKDHVLLLDRFKFSLAEAGATPALKLTPDGEHGHPTYTHRVLGKPTPKELEGTRSAAGFQGSIECLTCHDPHKGKHKALLARGALNVPDACAECHKK